MGGVQCAKCAGLTGALPKPERSLRIGEIRKRRNRRSDPRRVDEGGMELHDLRRLADRAPGREARHGALGQTFRIGPEPKKHG